MEMLLLFATLRISSIRGGINWNCCPGCCRRGISVEEIPRRRQAQHSSMIFMDLNESRPVHRRYRAWDAPKRYPKADQAISQEAKRAHELSYQSCQSIVLDLPLTKYRGREQIKDQLIRKCVQRWQELKGDVPPDLRNVYRPSDSQTTNLVILKLDGTITDSPKVSWESNRPQIIRQYNKKDFVFNQISTRNDPRLAMLVRTLVIYRKGLMKLFHTLKSGKIKGNSFDIALIGDLNFDSVFNAVAMETYFNWNYLQMIFHEQDLVQLTSQQFQELQLNFVFAQRDIPQSHLGRYQRVIIVASKWMHVPETLSESSQIIRIKVQPFLMILSSTSKGKDSVLRHMCNQRNLGDNSLDKVKAFLMDIDINAELVSGQDWVIIGQDELYNGTVPVVPRHDDPMN